jgi:GNAT superfamily N-acetyltransferase
MRIVVDGGVEAEADGEAEAVVHVVGLDHPQARELEQRHIEEMKRLYGGRGPGPLEGDEFEPPGGCFVVAVLDGSALACGGFHHLRPGVAEIKRMYVDSGARRRGLGRRVLQFLEDEARAAGYAEAWLETGSEQPEAMALYVSAGYRPVAPYGEFKEDERCRCFARTLAG